MDQSIKPYEGAIIIEFGRQGRHEDTFMFLLELKLGAQVTIYTHYRAVTPCFLEQLTKK